MAAGTQQWSWTQWSACLRTAAEQQCGRSPKSRDIACMPEVRKDLIESQSALAKSYVHAMRAKHDKHPNQRDVMKQHRALESSTRRYERRCKVHLINHLCDAVDRAMVNHDTGAMYRHTRSLSIWSNNTHELTTVDCVTGSQFRETLCQARGKAQRGDLRHARERAAGADCGMDS